MCLKSWYLQLVTQKNIFSFVHCTNILYFFLKYLPHFWQCNAINVFSTWIITEIKLCVSHLWKKLQDDIVHQKHLQKTPNFCLALCKRYQNNIHLSQNPKLPRTSMGVNNRNLSNKTVKDWALWVVRRLKINTLCHRQCNLYTKVIRKTRNLQRVILHKSYEVTLVSELDKISP